MQDDKITSSSSVRSLLKNLGSWLGMLTLQRNKPILQRHLDVRSLLVQAYDAGRLVLMLLVYEALSYLYMRPYNTSVLGLKLLVDETFRYSLLAQAYDDRP